MRVALLTVTRELERMFDVGPISEDIVIIPGTFVYWVPGTVQYEVSSFIFFKIHPFH